MSEIGQKLIAGVKAAAEERPDYVYERPKTPEGKPKAASCMYVRDGQPSCIVGHAAFNLGLIDSGFELRPENTGGVSELLDTLGLEVDREELYWLDEAQEQQDTGSRWDAAVANADTALATLDDDHWDDE